MAKMAEKVYNLHKRLSHSVPYRLYGVGTRKHFFGSIWNKTKRFTIFDLKKEGGHGLTPRHPFPTSLKTSKKWVSSTGSLGGGGDPD